MILAVPKEILVGEQRVAALPETIAQYVEMGFEPRVQSAAGRGALCSDEQYRQAGAEIVADPEALFRRSELILKVKQPIFNAETGKHEVEMMREGEKARFIIPPHLAYGLLGDEKQIPARSIIVYEVELLESGLD